jgi:hypothetical protein
VGRMVRRQDQGQQGDRAELPDRAGPSSRCRTGCNSLLSRSTRINVPMPSSPSPSRVEQRAPHPPRRGAAEPVCQDQRHPQPTPSVSGRRGFDRNRSPSRRRRTASPARGGEELDEVVTSWRSQPLRRSESRAAARPTTGGSESGGGSTATAIDAGAASTMSRNAGIYMHQLRRLPRIEPGALEALEQAVPRAVAGVRHPPARA